MLDMEAGSLEQIADLVLDNMINKEVLSVELREKVRTYMKEYYWNTCPIRMEKFYRDIFRQVDTFHILSLI